MLGRRNWGRLIATGAVASAGAVGLGQLMPLLRIDSSVCVHPAAGLGEIGLRLHVFSAAAGCPRGSYLPGENLGAVVQFSFAVSVLALVAGTVLALGALGVGWWAASMLGRLRDWLRRRLSTGLAGLLPRPERAPVAVAIPVRVSRTTHSPQWRRGPPTGC